MPGIMVERQRRDEYLFELATLEINAIWRRQFFFNAAKIKQYMNSVTSTLVLSVYAIKNTLA